MGLKIKLHKQYLEFKHRTLFKPYQSVQWCFLPVPALILMSFAITGCGTSSKQETETTIKPFNETLVQAIHRLLIIIARLFMGCQSCYQLPQAVRHIYFSSRYCVLSWHA